MIKVYFSRFLISSLLFLSATYAATSIISPQSIISFVGPCAAIFSGLILVWGLIPLITLITVSPVIAFMLKHHFKLDVSLAILLIALLTIILQGVWTHLLVFRFIRYKKWLISRKHLFFFLLRIGPLASVISASAVLFIAVLDNRVFQGSYLYNFMNTWSATMLISVFFIPLLLLVKNAEQLKFTKRVFVSFTSILGGIALLTMLKITQNEQQHHREEFFQQSTAEIELAIKLELEEVANKVNSLSALFVASDSVSTHEFDKFSQNILQQKSSVKALQWAPIVPSSRRSFFEESQSSRLDEAFVIKEFNTMSLNTSGVEQPYLAPLTYIFPMLNDKSSLGMNLYKNLNHTLTTQKLTDGHGIIAGAPTLKGKSLHPTISFSKAVFVDKNRKIAKSNQINAQLPSLNQQLLLGFVIAEVQFDEFFQFLAAKYNNKVSFVVSDTTLSDTFTIFGELAPSGNRFIKDFNLAISSRAWHLTVVEKSSWFSQNKSWQAWATLSAGTFGALLFQTLLLMMAAYSSELGHQVDTKTRALVLAKENSEKKSRAKSQLLKNLNTELGLPLNAIKSLIQQMKAKGINNKELTGIDYAGNNITLLLDTMMDLSDIESGEISIKQQSFDFYGLLERIEALINASNKYKHKSFSLLVDDSVPHYINSDELYIQKLIYALIEGGHDLLNTDKLRISIKLHKHKLADPSLFFTISSQNHSLVTLSKQAINQQNGADIASKNTAMAMAIKYSQLLRGDTKLGISHSGIQVLNASIRVVISTKKQQETHQGLTFDLNI